MSKGATLYYNIIGFGNVVTWQGEATLTGSVKQQMKAAQRWMGDPRSKEVKRNEEKERKGENVNQ